MRELNVDCIDRSHKFRQGIQLRLCFAPMAVRLPVAHEVLHRCQLNALRSISDGLLVGPPCPGQASAEVNELLFRNVDVEGAD